MDITPWVSCVFSLVYLISFKLKLVNYFKNLTNIKKLECMEYICDIIFITKSENLHIYFKIRIVGEIF